MLAEAEAVAEETAEAELTNLYGEDTIVSEEGLQTPKDQVLITALLVQILVKMN